MATNARQMRLRIITLLVLLALPQLARGGSACCEFCSDQYQQEGQFPYFEVIRTRRLIPDTEVVGGQGWKRVFESCAQMRRINITASDEVTVVARAFLQLSDQTTPGLVAQLSDTLTPATDYCANIADVGGLRESVNFSMRISHP